LLTATAAALLVTAWRRSLGGRTLAAFAVWFAVGVSPYLLLRWNCYPYYALFGLLPLTVLAAAASDSRFSSKALALYATSVVLVLAGQYVVPFPATLARARLAEESLRLIRSQQVQQAPVYIVIEQAESEFNAVGWEKGIALRTGTEADRWQVTTTPPDNATILRFRPRTTPIWESSE
jgi:hypothetical protein